MALREQIYLMTLNQLEKVNNIIINIKMIRQAKKLRDKWSLQNSRRVSHKQSQRNSEEKLKKIKYGLRPVQIISRLQKQGYSNKNSISTTVKTPYNQPAYSKIIKTLSNQGEDEQKLLPEKYINSIDKCFNIKKSIRIRTEQQKRSMGLSSGQKELASMEDKIKRNESSSTEKINLLTKYEQEQTKIYQPLFLGQRRIHCDEDFTDIQGNVIIKSGDSIKFRYEIKSELGHGAFGFVYKAFDHKRKQMVALKIIKNNIKYQKQAKVQIRILEQVIENDEKQNQNIVQLKSAFLFRGHPCLVFQLLHLNLYQFCFQMGFIGISLDLTRRFCIQMLHGLNFLEKFKIVHCDIKPQNIMIKRQNKTGLKLIDFGSSCFDGEQIYNYVQSRFYRSPEIILGIKYGCPIDMWSFGCVAFQLFSGKPLFPGQDEEDQMSLFIETLGMPPKELLKKGSRSNKFFTMKEFEYKTNFTTARAKLRIPEAKNLQKQLKRCPDAQFINFVKRCLSWAPQSRLKASEALLHPWILSGIPDELRNEHKRSVLFL